MQNLSVRRRGLGQKYRTRCSVALSRSGRTKARPIISAARRTVI